MGIDFTMTGLNLCLLIGVVLLLLSVCLLIMQNPIKNKNKMTVRDYIISAFILCCVIGGIVLTVLGFIDAFNLIKMFS